MEFELEFWSLRSIIRQICNCVVGRWNEDERFNLRLALMEVLGNCISKGEDHRAEVRVEISSDLVVVTISSTSHEKKFLQLIAGWLLGWLLNPDDKLDAESGRGCYLCLRYAEYVEINGSNVILAFSSESIKGEQPDRRELRLVRPVQGIAPSVGINLFVLGDGTSVPAPS